MGMNMTEKILARHAGLEEVKPGQLIFCKLDMVLANDVTAPPSIKEFEKIGRPVFDPAKIALVPDHFTPNKDIKSAENIIVSAPLWNFGVPAALKAYIDLIVKVNDTFTPE